ncbi:hypothetical protein [Brevibacillus sp. 179-C 1.1 NHS]|uniref:hypothetical protein n=1 Tax=Brevibacillus sp. 179-C 1.1 NHS TaxID=3235177 RepID=UPI00399FA723
MLAQIWSSVYVYLMMLALTPFGLVGIPQGIGILRGNIGFGMSFYVVLFVNPFLYRLYLYHLKKRMEKKRLTWRQQDQWMRGIIWTLGSHFIVYELLYFSLPQIHTSTNSSPPFVLMALSAVALLFLAGSTSYVSYKYSPTGVQSRFFG